MPGSTIRPAASRPGSASPAAARSTPIARRAAFPTAAPVVESRDAEPTLDPCVYEGATIVALFNGQAGDTFTQKPYLPTSSCTYKGSAGNTRISA